MKNYLILKNIIAKIKEYIFIFSTATIILAIASVKSYSEEKVFSVSNLKVQATVDLNFSRDKYIKKAFYDSFNILMSKILLSKDLKRIKNIKKNQIITLIKSFQITEEKYRKNQYYAEFIIHYDENKVRKLLYKNNISYSRPKSITAIFFPILYVDDDMNNFKDNYFYQNWNNIEIDNEVINFLLPIDDLEDISNIEKIKNNFKSFEVDNLIYKYDVKNYAFALMNYNNKKIKIYLKTNFEGSKISKNLSYELKSINDDLGLSIILKDLKREITDLWKQANLINLLMPLSINIKFEHKNLTELNNLKKTLYKVNIIDNFSLEKFDIKNSDFQIFYYGNPKRLKLELLSFGYDLNNDNGYWGLKLNE